MGREKGGVGWGRDEGWVLAGREGVGLVRYKTLTFYTLRQFFNLGRNHKYCEQKLGQQAFIKVVN